MTENHEKPCFTFFAFLPPYFGVSGFFVSGMRRSVTRSIDWYQKFLISCLAARYSTVFVLRRSKWLKIYWKSIENLLKIYWKMAVPTHAHPRSSICIFTGYLACRVDLARRGYLGGVCTGRSMHTWVKVPENPDPGIPHNRGGIVMWHACVCIGFHSKKNLPELISLRDSRRGDSGPKKKQKKIGSRCFQYVPRVFL